ncbi:MAG: hypothetical protein HYX68_06215 [Planctomycetes bacterium]|nr:hypothetical protein [Planctomycetota bacterium]
MRSKTWIAGVLLISTVGCSSMNNTEKGMLGGAAVGTGAGALIGRGNPVAMLVGGIFGTAIGGMAGSNQDYREDRRAATIAAVNAQAARQMSINEVVQLSQRNTPDSIIIDQIRTTGSVFNLSTDDLTYLQDQRVSPRVIQEMQARRHARPVVIQEGPVIVGPPPVIYEPAPVFGVGIGYGRRW